MKTQNKVYVMPEHAKKKLRRARKVNQPVYIYGATGYGKTELVRRFLGNKNYTYISCINGRYDLHFLEEESAKKKSSDVVVLDDLWQISNRDAQQEIRSLLDRENIWVILINRSKVPGWLLSASVDYGFMIISEEDLRLQSEDILSLAEGLDVSLTFEQAEVFRNRAVGNPYAVLFTLQAMQDGEVFSEKLMARIEQEFARYMEHELLTSWDEDLLEFLLQISVVDCFDEQLAEFITGNSHVSLMIEKALECGNFLSKEGEIYTLRPQLIISLRNYAGKIYGSARIREYLYNAGLYYEMHDHLVEAIHMYQLSGNRSRVKEILIRNARRHPAAGFYFEFRKEYLQLTREEVETSPVLMAAMCMLYSLMMQIQESEYWYKRLKEFAAKERGAGHREAIARLAYLDITLPHRGSRDLLEIFLHVTESLISGMPSVPEISVSSNLPSIMNGGKDFCEWSKKDKELARTVGMAVTVVLGRTGKGIVNTALGESFFEKGEDDFGAIKHLSKAQMEAENGDNLEMLFVVSALQARISLIHGDRIMANAQIDAFENKLDKNSSKQLLDNLHAFRCRLALYENDQEKIIQWMQQAPSPEEVFTIMERYRYLTKVRCFMMMGDNLNALKLLEQIRFYAEQFERTFIMIETGILEAIILKRMGEEWQDLFKATLQKAEEYHFVRVISREGAAVLPLLKETKWSSGQRKGNWWKQVQEETERMAKYYPQYLGSGAVTVSDFSENAVRILKMQEEGMTIRQIASELNLAEATIKYHAAETYRKLEVKGKTAAVQKAKRLNII